MFFHVLPTFYPKPSYHSLIQQNGQRVGLVVSKGGIILISHDPLFYNPEALSIALKFTNKANLLSWWLKIEILLTSGPRQNGAVGALGKIHNTCVPKDSSSISGIELACSQKTSEKSLLLSKPPLFLIYKMKIAKHNMDLLLWESQHEVYVIFIVKVIVIN